MKLDDFFDLERGPESIVRLAAYALVIVVVGSLVATILGQLNAADLLVAMLLLAIMSPVAYVIREYGQDHGRRPRTHPGAERTPLVPQVEEEE